MDHSLQIMFILLLMTGHLFWKAIILVAFTEGFHCILENTVLLKIGHYYSLPYSVYLGLGRNEFVLIIFWLNWDTFSLK